MNTCIKKLFFALVLCSAAFTVSAEAAGVDLSITVISLADAVESGRNVPAEGTTVILNGTVTERRVISDEPEFQGELLLSSGEWLSSEEISVSSCIILLQGAEFSRTIPVRRSRRPDPAEITLNSELLVYGEFLGTAETDEGVKAVVSAIGLRKLK